MKSPTKSPTFIIGLVLGALGIVFIFIGQTQGIGALLLIVGSACMLIPIARSMLGSTADLAPKKASATTPDEALHAMFSHLRTTSPPKTTSGQAATRPRPVTPPLPKPTLASIVPKLPNEKYRTEVYGEKELLIVTTEKLIIWGWGGALSSVRLSLVNTATVGDHFLGLWQIWVHTSIGPVPGFWSLNMRGKEKAYEVAQMINNAVALYG